MNRYLPHLALIFALFCNAAANLLIKYSMSRGTGRLGGYLSPIYLLALALFGVNLLAYSWSLKSFKMSSAYPLMVSGGFLLILLASRFLFAERLSGAQYTGVGLIVAGIWLVVR